LSLGVDVGKSDIKLVETLSRPGIGWYGAALVGGISKFCMVQRISAFILLALSRPTPFFALFTTAPCTQYCASHKLFASSVSAIPFGFGG
jgi:hypothetical protein